MAIPQEPIFKQEVEKFLHNLQNSKSKKKAAFIGRIQVQNQNHTPEELLESVQLLMKECSDKRMRKWYHKSFTPVVDAIKDYTGVIDTLVSSYPMPTALIWGGLKIVLDCAGRHGQQFEKIKSHLETLQGHLWDLANCELLYGSSCSSPYSADVVRHLISKSYITILNFWYRCTKIIEHPMRYVAVTDQKLLAILSDLKKDSEELSKICERAEALLNKEARDGMTEEFVKSALERCATQIDREVAESERMEAAKEREKAEQERAAAKRSRELAEREFQEAERARLAAKAEREAAHSHRQNAISWQIEQDRRHSFERTQILKDGIDGHNKFSFLLLENAKSMRHPGTCEWIFQHESFLSWSAESTKNPVLWLHGQHGAGKSFICASAIEHILDICEGPPVFQFLAKDHYVSRNQLLRNLAQQLLEVLIYNSSELPQSLIPFLTFNKDDTRMVEKLVQAIIHELPLIYIFIDGLDEADYTDLQNDAPIPRAMEEVPLFVNFLINEAIGNPDKVRLWCSSQLTPEIQRYMYRQHKSSIIEVSLQTEDTARDIKKYLLAAIPESTSGKDVFAGLVIAAAISTEVEGSFLWASSMLEDLKDRAEDSDDLIVLAEKGLPTTMNDQYAKIIARIRRRVRGDKHLPLWKIVLSLIAFAKRPLHMSEIIEGVAIVRTASSSNLNENKRVDADKILTSCMSLVRLIKSKSESNNDGLLRLSHSAVAAFLMEYSDSSEDIDESDQLISSTIIKDCCLKYLMQPRYAGLLQKSGSGGFVTLNREDVDEHHLVLYAAKYWDKHADGISDDDEKATVEQFLQSDNFLACLQIQSRYVIGHFIQNFDPITDTCQSTKRSLPLWMSDNPMFRQYFSFTSEWGELLQRGIYAQFSGEIDRCFWTTLGKHHFLAKHQSRYQNFSLLDDTILDHTDKVCRVQQIAEDGKSVTVCWIRTDEEVGKVQLEVWNIDEGDTPRLEGRSVQEFSADEVRWALYSLPCSRSWPLIPDAERVDRPDAFTLHEGGKILRIGSHLAPNLAMRPLSEQQAIYSEKAITEAWEETRAQGSILVVCRRRLPRKETSEGDQRAEVRRIQNLQDRLEGFKSRDRPKRKSTKDQRRSDRARKIRALQAAIEGALTDDSGAEEETSELVRSKKKQSDVVGPEQYDNEESSASSLPSEPESSDLDSDEKDGIPSPGESWTEGSDTDDKSLSGETFSQCSERVSSGDDIASVQAMASDDESSDDAFDTSSESGFDEDSEIESDVSDEEDAPITQLARHESLMSYPVIITPRTKNITCDWCWKKCPIRWYHCPKCQGDDFDLCHACVRQGHWCLDKSHQLFEMDNAGTLGVTSSIGFKLRQELKVFSTSTTTPTLLYHFSMKYDAMLHDSAPAIHPKHSLVVWPLSGSQLLFADFKANSYFEQKIKTGSGRSRPICVNLSFSPCGNILRVATVDSTFLKPPKLKRKGKGPRKQLKPIMCLNLHVLILQLATSKPTRSPPKLIGSTTLQLGCGLKSHVQQLPFAFTWRESELYFTMSSSRLRVYKIALNEGSNTPLSSITPPTPASEPRTPANGDFFQDSCASNMCAPCEPSPNPSTSRRPAISSKSTALKVTVPKETIFLPRSARIRSVQFIPPHTPSGRSTVVIGPRNGSVPDPPIVVYFDAEDLGGWVGLAEKEGEESRLGGPEQALVGRYETFDTEQDCDIIFV